jgi:hypothetical protein
MNDNRQLLKYSNFDFLVKNQILPDFDLSHIHCFFCLAESIMTQVQSEVRSSVVGVFR